MIYIIIFISFAVIYIYDYAKQELYSYEYSYRKNDTKIMEEKHAESIMNTELDFWFLLDKEGEDLRKNDNFLIIDVEKLQDKIENKKGLDPIDNFTIINIDENLIDEFIIRKNRKYTTNPGNLRLAVLYRCHGPNGMNCNIKEEDRIQYSSYRLHYLYRGYSIEHQNPKKPIQMPGENEFFGTYLQFLENTNIIFVNWKLIQYEEKKEVFSKTFHEIIGKNNVYWGIDIGSFETFTDDGHFKNITSNFWKIKDEKGNHFILLLYVFNQYEDGNYDKYTRTSKSFIDAITNICALGSTVLNIMRIVYNFLYSKSYDNYKIIENILSEKLRININHINKNIDEKLLVSKIELNAGLIDSKSEEEENEKLGLDKNIDEEKEMKKSYENLDLPSLKFFDFFGNTFYLKCFGPSSKQSLIDSCNDIVFKFVTIESIVYNQMKLEYLWKDYKWNNPQYEIKEKDDMILNLKEK